MTKEQFKAFWKEKTKGLTRAQKRKLTEKYFNHYSWSAFTFGCKNRLADDPLIFRSK